MPECKVCFRHCNIPEGGRGSCGVRTCKDGVIRAANYGKITSAALDPVEKKPLRHFHPGKYVFSVGSYGCNLRCPFCQNHEISWSEEALRLENIVRTVSPEDIAEKAFSLVKHGNIGVAFTYNEPIVGYEFVRDTAREVRRRGMENVLVTNGTADISVLEEIIPYIGAMNIDLKCFNEENYRNFLGGDLGTVLEFIKYSAGRCHIEITVLIVPGLNDTEKEITEISKWTASLNGIGGNNIGKEIPLHISRFFPRFHLTDRPPTDVSLIYRLAEKAREHLKYVYTGNC